MTDWAEPFLRAQSAIKLAEWQLALGNHRTAYTALSETIEALMATQQAIRGAPARKERT